MQAVVSDRKFQKNVVTVAIGGRRARQGRFRLLCCHLGAQNDSAAWVRHCSAKVPRDLLRRGIEASKHYKCQHIANDVHVVFESPGRFDTTKQSDAVSSRDTVLKWIAVTCAPEDVPHRQGSVNYRIVAGNASSRGPLTFREESALPAAWMNSND